MGEKVFKCKEIWRVNLGSLMKDGVFGFFFWVFVKWDIYSYFLIEDCDFDKEIIY